MCRTYTLAFRVPGTICWRFAALLQTVPKIADRIPGQLGENRLEDIWFRHKECSFTSWTCLLVVSTGNVIAAQHIEERSLLCRQAVVKSVRAHVQRLTAGFVCWQLFPVIVCFDVY